MHAGNVLGLLMEATEQGRLSPPYRLSWGDTPRMLEALQGIASRQGFWRLAGEGLRPLAEELGLREEVVHVKGLEPAGYDPRGVQSMAITHGVGNRGATHLSSNSYARDISGQAREHELAGPDRAVDRFSLARKAELVANMIDFNSIADCFVLCRFLNRDLLAWEDYRRMLYLLTGMQKSESELKATARDIATLGRWYNLSCGLGPADDLLPARFFHETHAGGGSAGHCVSKADYLEELKRYYTLRGWNEQGVPGYRPWLPQAGPSPVSPAAEG